MAFFLDEIDSCLWDYLRQTEKKIVLYGMGDGAEKIKSVLDEAGVPVADIMASDEFVRGHSFLGYRVKKLSEIEELYGDDFLILVCFGSQIPEVMEHIYSIAEKHELYAPNVPVTGGGLFTLDYAREHSTELEKVYGMLADEQSRRVFENVIRYKLSGRINLLKECESPEEEMYDLLRIGAQETYVDLGAYNGDTIRELLHYTDGRFASVTALEPDRRSFRKLNEWASANITGDVTLVQAGAWNEDTVKCFTDQAGRQSRVAGQGKETQMRALDSVLSGRPCTYLKMDVEGAEREAIAGAEKTIRQYAPKLNIAAYHRSEDFFQLPLLIHALQPSYRLYLRHHPYVPAWDTNLYAI